MTSQMGPIQRKGTARQRAKHQAILSAACTLADEVAYEEFSTRAVAKSAGVALGTVYHYFATKDHLLSAATVRFADAFDQQLMLEPLRGETAEDRVIDLLERQAQHASDRPLRHRLLTHAISSADPAVAPCRRELARYGLRWLELALAEDDVDDRAVAIDLLGALSLRMLFAGLDRSFRDAASRSRIEASVRRVLSGPRHLAH